MNRGHDNTYVHVTAAGRLTCDLIRETYSLDAYDSLIKDSKRLGALQDGAK